MNAIPYYGIQICCNINKKRRLNPLPRSIQEKGKEKEVQKRIVQNRLHSILNHKAHFLSGHQFIFELMADA
jgi:hypothetical protein